MKTIKNIFTIKSLVIILFYQLTANSQVIVKTQPVSLNSTSKTEAIKNIVKLLNDNYVFPDKAAEMGKFILTKLNTNEYKNINDSRAFGDQLSKDLQSISHDKHLWVRYNPEDASEIRKNSAGSKDEEVSSEEIEMMKYENYGFKKVERLNGNIGYVDFRNFSPSKYSKETIESVMGFLSNCDAIIIDLRQNGGGDPTGVQMISSYFFDSNPVHLNDLYFRPENRTDEFWTLKEINGNRMPDVDLYILTSNYTFSAAEEFTYNLKNLKRATIVGETTGGGAHPGDVLAVNADFVIFVPNGNAINPITKSNWEGTGVIPDIAVSQDKALQTAKLNALEKLAQKTSDEKIKSKLQWEAESVKAELNPWLADEATLKNFAGNYGERQITFEDGDLYYQRTGRPKMKMIPLTEDQFMFKEVDVFRVKFVKDSMGNVVELQGIYDIGQVDVSKKVN
ncbi:MAG: S41 family peptidase [Bacteroidota bacterium]|nr:S41 family peptidase [Bacteroidota bacterium]